MFKQSIFSALLAVFIAFQASAVCATQYNLDPNFGVSSIGQTDLDLSDANGKETWALRVFERPASAGYYILARHGHGNGTWDAIVLAVDAQGKHPKKYLIPTSMFRLDDATLDAGNGKFYFVGGAKRAGYPDSDFAVTCLDITIGTSGGPCAGFGTNGTVLTSFDLGGNKDDVARRVISRPGTGIIVAGWAKDGTSRYVFAVSAYYRDSGAPLTRFGTNGKFHHDVYQTGNANLDVNVYDIALSDDPAQTTTVYIAGNYSRVAAHNDYVGLVWALNGWDGTLAPFGTYGYAQIQVGLGNCAVDCSEAVTALTIKTNRHIAFAGQALNTFQSPRTTIGGLTAAGAPDLSLCLGAGVCVMGPSFRDLDSDAWAIAELPQNRELHVLTSDRFQDSDGFHQYSETRQGRQNGVGYGYFTWRYAQTEMNYPADAIWVGKSMIQVGTYEVDATTKDYRIAIQRWMDIDTIFFDQFGGKASD